MILLGQAFAHCPIFLTAGFTWKLEPCLSSNVADHSFKSAKDRRLGCPLQNQLPNPIKARPLTKLIFIYYQVFYTQLKGRLPRHYSPVRYVFVKH